MSKDDEEMRRTAAELLAGSIPGGMNEGLIALHEMYQELKRAGFREFQALWIVAYVLAGGPNPGVFGNPE